MKDPSLFRVNFIPSHIVTFVSTDLLDTMVTFTPVCGIVVCNVVFIEFGAHSK